MSTRWLFAFALATSASFAACKDSEQQQPLDVTGRLV